MRTTERRIYKAEDDSEKKRQLMALNDKLTLVLWGGSVYKYISKRNKDSFEQNKPLLSEKEKIDLLHKEFLFEHSRADIYIERNYRILAVWFPALTALLTIGINKDLFDTNQAILMIFAIVLPAVNYVCAAFYAFNSYANMLCGYRAEVIHRAIYPDPLVDSFNVDDMSGEKTRKDFKPLLPRYILSNALVSAPTYISVILVFLGSSAFGYYYAYYNCVDVYRDYVIVSLLIMVALILVSLILYICPLLVNAVSRNELKNEKK